MHFAGDAVDGAEGVQPIDQLLLEQAPKYNSVSDLLADFDEVVFNVDLSYEVTRLAYKFGSLEVAILVGGHQLVHVLPEWAGAAEDKLEGGAMRDQLGRNSK